MITLEQMRCFCAVYEQGSYIEAAKKLNKDRSTVREHINSLEDVWGIDLFQIEGRKSVANKFSKVMYHRARVFIRHAEEIEHTAQSFLVQPTTEVNIYHDVLLPTQLALFVTKKLDAAYPAIQLNWLQRNREEAMADIIDRKCQLAILPTKFLAQPEKAVNFKNLGGVKIAIYAGTKSRLAQLSSISSKDLQLEKQFLSENHFRAELEVFRVSTKPHLISNNNLIVDLIKDHGWTILSEPFAQAYVDKDEIVKLKLNELIHDYKYNLILYSANNCEQNEVLAELMDWITEYAEEHFV